MRRVLLGVVLVLGGWTSCQPVTGGEPMAGPTTAGLAALIEAEGWHYVGETGEPAWFQVTSVDAWENQSADFNLAFRIRESGIVDIHGVIAPVASPSTSNQVFLLPEGYRPSAQCFMPAVGLAGSNLVPVSVDINALGYMTILNATSATYPVAGGTQPLSRVYLSLQMFLDPPDAP